MEYTEADLPVEIKHGEFVKLQDGTEIRFESNGEAKDVFVGDSYSAEVQLFPDCDYEMSTESGMIKMTACFHDGLKVEKV